MDKSRCYCVLSKANKAIYATNKTELQATKILDKLVEEGVKDASILYNGNNELAKRKYDKYKLDIKF